MNTDDKNMPVFCGTAVFKKSRLIDYLDVEETKAMLFLKNEIEGVFLLQEQTLPEFPMKFWAIIQKQV